MKKCFQPLGLVLLLSGTIDVAPAQTLLSARHVEQRLTVQAAGSLKEALDALEKEYKVSFICSSEAASLTVRRERPARAGSLEEKLEAVLTPLGYTFRKVEDNFYAVVPKAGAQPATKPKTEKRLPPEAGNGNVRPVPVPLPEVAPRDFTVSGRVTARTGDPLPGVNVLLEGTTTGTTTDAEGNYTLVAPDGNGTLVFSYIGYVSRRVPVSGRSTVDVTLAEDIQSLSEVVVTALGFKEDRDKLGSTSSKIGGSQLARSGEANVIDALAGKASGVRISRSSGSDPGAASQILIRGQSSITRGLQPLIVLDGIPISNSSIGEGNAGVSQQARLNDINPDDIESVQVLKGASAAALWGTRAANGVIIITTKKGKANNKVNVSFKSTYSLDEVNRRHPLQSAFGQGTGGRYNPNASRSWGDRIADREGGEDLTDQEDEYFVAQDGSVYYPVARGTATNPHGGKRSLATFNDSNFDQVFQTGHFWDNSLSISGADEKTSYFFSLSDLDQEGVIRNNSDYRRTTLRFNAERRFNDVVRLATNTTYARVGSNRIRRGNSSAGLYLGLLRTPTDFDNSDYTGSYYSEPGGAALINRQRSYRNYLGSDVDPGFNNPNWTINRQENTSIVNRLITSAELGIKPVSWFELITRGGIDSYTDRRNNYQPLYSQGAEYGAFSEDLIQETQFNLDVIGRASKDFGDKFSATLIGGFNFNNRQSNVLEGSIQNFIIPDGPRDFNNATQENISLGDNTEVIRTTAGYASANFGFADMLYINLTGRAEAASTFGANSNNTFFYPSADVAWQFTKTLGLENNPVFNFGKLRAAYGVVGIQPGPYNTITNYFAPTWGDSFGPTLATNVYGNGAFVESGSQGNDALKPERKTEYEVGADLRFFTDRVRTSVTYYRNETVDALLSIPTAASTGFRSRYTNAAAIENRGWEVDLNFDILRSGPFAWSAFVNWNRNRNRVLSLQGSESIDLGGLSGVSSRAVVGQPLGVLWGGRWQRDETGSLLLNDDGFPQQAEAQGVIGDPNPDWQGGAGSTFSFKGVSLSVLFETFQGADLAAATKGALLAYGTHAETGVETVAPQDLTNYAGDVIPAGTAFRGRVGDFGAGPVALDEEWYDGPGGYFGGVLEQFVEDGSWTRLREVTLSYSLTSKAFRKFTRLQSVDFSVAGRNLLLWTKFGGIDPDTNLTGSGSARGIDYFNNPGTRSFLFTIRINY